MRRALTVFSMLLLAGLSACGGGGGGGGTSSYTGLTTAAVITTSNADDIARQAFQGGDLGANATTLASVRSGDVRTVAGKPMMLTLVQFLSGVASAAFPGPVAVRSPLPRSSYTDWFPDGMGIGRVDFTLNINDLTGAFTGTFTFMNFHGDGGGIIDGPVSVSGQYVQGQGITEIRFNFRSVRIVDGAEDVTAIGTVDLVSGTGGGSATLDIVFRDNASAKTVWLSNFTLDVTEGTGSTDVRMFGRIYLHDYGYVDVHTEAGFIYPTGSSLPTSGAITLTGSASCRARFTVVDAATYMVELDADGNGSYEWTVTRAW
ncbi:MAG: hypothetical protein ACYC37_11915 [Desulfobacteria bacterium]